MHVQRFFMTQLQNFKQVPNSKQGPNEGPNEVPNEGQHFKQGPSPKKKALVLLLGPCFMNQNCCSLF